MGGLNQTKYIHQRKHLERDRRNRRLEQMVELRQEFRGRAVCPLVQLPSLILSDFKVDFPVFVRYLYNSLPFRFPKSCWRKQVGYRMKLRTKTRTFKDCLAEFSLKSIQNDIAAGETLALLVNPSRYCAACTSLGTSEFSKIKQNNSTGKIKGVVLLECYHVRKRR